MSHKVFISYSPEDRDIADSICAHLECGKIRCWIAPRDVFYRENDDESVIRAIDQSFILLLIISKNSNRSYEVLKEVEIAVRGAKFVLPLRIDDVPIHDDLNKFIGTITWLEVVNSPLEEYMEKLVSLVKNVLIYLEEDKFTIFLQMIT